MTQTDGVATCVTAEPHDFTLNEREGDDFVPDVTIVGASPSGWNGTYPVTAVLNRTTFEFQVDDSLADASGSIVAVDGKNRGFNGYKSAITVTGTDEFTYPLSAPLPPAAGFGQNMRATFGFRISGVANAEKIIDYYTEQNPNESWAFVVLGDSPASRNRRIDEDSTYVYSDGQDYRQTLIQPFTVYVVEPTTELISGRPARDKMQDLLLPFFKSLLRFKTSEPFAAGQNYGVTFVRHGFFSYNKAFYMHAFDFENIVEITYDDTLSPSNNVAFRDVAGSIESKTAGEDTQAAEFEVNLDEMPN